MLVALAASLVFHGAVLYGVGQGLSGTSHASGLRKAQAGSLDARLVHRSLQETRPANAADDASPLLQIPRQEAQAGKADRKRIAAPDDKASVAADKSSPAGSAIVDVPVFEVPFTPRYPLQLLAQGIRGSVTVSFRVSRIGGAEGIELIDSAPAGVFDAAVIDALMRAQLDIDSVRPGSAWVVTVVFDATGTNPQGPVSHSVAKARP